MNILRIIPPTLAILCLGQAPAIAPDERKLAEEILTLTNVEKVVVEMRAQIGQMMTAQINSMDIPAEMRDKVTALQKQILDAVFEEYTFEKLKMDYVEAYVTVFTADELAGLLEFYKTPAGRAFTDKLPALTKRTLEISQARMQALVPRIKKMNDDFIASVKKGAGSEK